MIHEDILGTIGNTPVVHINRLAPPNSLKRRVGVGVSLVIHFLPVMAARNPRVNAVLDRALYEQVEVLAKGEGVSLSQKVRDLVRDALELVEDEGLESRVEARRRTRNRSRWISHSDLKRRLRIS